MRSFGMIAFATLLVSAGVISGIAFAQAKAKNLYPFEGPSGALPKPGEPGKVTVVSDAANLISLEINGAWEVDSDLFKRLNPTATKTPTITLKFKDDKAHSDKAIAALEKWLAAPAEERDSAKLADAEVRETMRRVYKAGAVEFADGDRGETFSYLLFVWRGAPMLAILEENDSNFEGVQLSFARDPKGDADILFVGGDRTDEPFMPMKRKQEKKD